MEEIYLNPIHLFWIGSKFSPIEILCCKSCLKQGMTPVLWCYQEIKGIPAGVVIEDANTILPIDTVNYYIEALKLPIPNISDLFRYRLLHKIGGIYSDTDIIFTDNIYQLNKTAYFCSTYEYNYGELANGCLMKLEKNSKISTFLLEEPNRRLINYIETGNDLHYCEFGPFVIQKCAAELNVEILKYDVINPISWRWVNKLIAYKKIDRIFHIKLLVRKLLPFIYESKGYFVTKNTKAIHLCHEMWNTYEINKYETMNSLSLYETLKIRFDRN
ncbi:hypothetical protein QF042_004475 [Pedobacter sp. W3I1]|uniref:glycosyltransferase n=1 Tax=Pedobacter sp. W3I1 TaxID=3042291 RepID=UPI0027880A15|nr:glycosyltransferase [Pedobacter sp. W3I1]MDQ0640910.1 hypothetical protein [Pedobacter sp. W3I1]